MAFEKNKNDKGKDVPNAEIMVVQTVVRDGAIVNRQLNSKDI